MLVSNKILHQIGTYLKKNLTKPIHIFVFFRQEEQVQIARKYCLEEKKGKYYCLKDGKCFGNMCKGSMSIVIDSNVTKFS